MPDSDYVRRHTIETNNDTFDVDVEAYKIDLDSGLYHIWKADFTNSEGDKFTMYISDDNVTIANFDGKFTKKEEKEAAEAAYKMMGIYQDKTDQKIGMISASYRNESGKEISSAFYKTLRKKIEFEDQGNWLSNYANRTCKYAMDIVPGCIRASLKDIEKYDEMTADDFKDFTETYSNNSNAALEKYKLKDIRKFLDSIGASGKYFVEMIENSSENTVNNTLLNVDYTNSQTIANTLKIDITKETFDDITLDDKINENTKENKVLSINEKSQER